MTDSRRLWGGIAATLVVSRLLMAVGIALAVWGGYAHPGPDFMNSVFNSWDGEAYIRIADHGYSTVPDPRYVANIVSSHLSLRLNPDDAFMPLYPAAIRFVSAVTQTSLVIAGLIVSLTCEAAALFFVHRLIERESNAGVAWFCMVGLALSPLSFFLGAVYTESMFIAAAAAALYFARSGRFALASLATVLACATRITGVAVCLALAIEYVRQRGLRPSRDALLIVLTPLPYAVFALYMQVHTGDALALFHANTIYFDHEFASPITGFQASVTAYGATSEPMWKFAWFREIAFGVLGVVFVVVAWLTRRFPKSFSAYGTVVVVSAIAISFWRSVPRYELALFPFGLIVARLVGRHWLPRYLALIGSAMMFTACSFVYAQGWLA